MLSFGAGICLVTSSPQPHSFLRTSRCFSFIVQMYLDACSHRPGTVGGFSTSKSFFKTQVVGIISWRDIALLPADWEIEEDDTFSFWGTVLEIFAMI